MYSKTSNVSCRGVIIPYINLVETIKNLFECNSCVFINRTKSRRKPTQIKEEPSEDTQLAPQIKIDEFGNIVIDEESLKIDGSAADRKNREVIQEDEETWIRFVRKKVHRTSWSIEETLRFYQALSVVGTDFTLLRWFLPQYTRDQIKVEEKINIDLLDNALSRYCNLILRSKII
ncbi:hypothetical protein HZS_3759 [Henneguya salminicola]|nr:hypothetical protein HZS_3759 [Henneguya salminicola]